MWDDLDSSPCFLTYSELMWRVQLLTGALSGHLCRTSSPHAPVAVYGTICPGILVAILGILSCRLQHQQRELGVGVVKGVAYLPVDMSWPAPEQYRRLLECGVELFIIEISAMEVREIK